MTNELRTDDEIAELFAAANPFPNEPLIGSPTNVPPGDGRVGAQNRSNVMIDLTERTADRTKPAQRRWRAPAAAAAAGLAVVAGVVFVTSGDDADAPAGPTPVTSVPTAPVVTPPPPDATAEETVDADPVALLALVDEFILAFNSRDVETLRSVVIEPVDLLAELTQEGAEALRLGWYDAFDWRWEDVSCDVAGDVVDCDMTTRNRLTEFSGVDIPTNARFTIVEERIDRLNLVQNFGEYSNAAFTPFTLWVAATHPDELRNMWTFSLGGANPIVNPDSVELFEANLTEYTGPDAVEPLHLSFLGAQSDGDAEASLAALAPDAVVDQLWAKDQSELTAFVQLLDAVDWEWNVGACSIALADPDSVQPTLRCIVYPTSAWSDAGIRFGWGRLILQMTREGISSVTSDSMATQTGEDLEPFWEWVRTQHPDDAESLLIERDGTTMPVLQQEAIARFDELVDEFVSEFVSGAGS